MAQESLALNKINVRFYFATYKLGLFILTISLSMLYNYSNLSLNMTEACSVVINCKKLKIGTSTVGP